MIRWLLSLWHRQQRAIDLAVLWPACRQHARTLEHARAAFASHALSDPAWRELGEAEISRQINALE